MEKKKVIKLFLFLLVLILVFLPGYSKFQELNQKNSALKEEIRQLEISNKKLSGEVRLLKGDPVYMEKIARDKLKVTRKGEIIYKVAPEEKTSQKR